MTSRQRIRNIIANKPADRCGLWLGMPKPETLEIYYRYFKVQTEEELRRKLGDDFRWIAPWTYRGAVKDNPFPIAHKVSHGDPGPFARATSVRDLDDYEWPKAELMISPTAGHSAFEEENIDALVRATDKFAN